MLVKHALTVFGRRWPLLDLDVVARQVRQQRWQQTNKNINTHPWPVIHPHGLCTHIPLWRHVFLTRCIICTLCWQLSPLQCSVMLYLSSHVTALCHPARINYSQHSQHSMIQLTECQNHYIHAARHSVDDSELSGFHLPTHPSPSTPLGLLEVTLFFVKVDV